jgi:cation transport ATPase
VSVDVLHETATRLRAAWPAHADEATLRSRLETLPGVQSVRVNATLRCVVVHHDGLPGTRDAVLERLASVDGAPLPESPRRAHATPAASSVAWTPALLSLALPLLSGRWRAAGALAVIAARALAQREQLVRDPAAVLLDAASQTAAALSGHPLVVTASVASRTLSEALSARLVAQADDLLRHLLPVEAPRYAARRVGEAGWRSVPPDALRAGDRVRLAAGDVVPVDGRVVRGHATLAATLHHASGAPRAVAAGEPLAAGEQLHDGALELVAESDAAGSRLERLRAHLRHAAGARDPAGRLAPEIERLVSLPLTGAALVMGLTGDASRAAAMLQADPQQGLDLALPLAREAVLYTLARQGLLAGGLEVLERLAVAPTLVLQDSGVLACGRWRVAAVRTARGVDAQTVHGWLARLAGADDGEAPATPTLGDAVVRRWWRHGALLPDVGGRELHLASPARLREVWRLELPPLPAAAAGLQRTFAFVQRGRVVARVTLASDWRDGAAANLAALRALGFERIALLPETDDAPAAPLDGDAAGVEWIDPRRAPRDEWFADAVRDGRPLVLAHTVWRDLVPPGSVSLCPVDADAGAHGVLLGDPLASLVAARRLAQAVHRRLRRQQGAAVAVNAALMTAAALRWLPPEATALLHHGFVFALLFDSLRIEALDAPDVSVAAPAPPSHDGTDVPLRSDDCAVSAVS